MDPEQGELCTLTQLVSDAAEVCEGFHRLTLLTYVVGTPPLPVLPCHGPIRLACCPNTPCPPLSTLIPSRFQRYQIEKEFGLEIEPRGDEIGVLFSRKSPSW